MALEVPYTYLSCLSIREEPFINLLVGGVGRRGRFHFDVVGKNFDDPPNPVGKTYSTPAPTPRFMTKMFVTPQPSPQNTIVFFFLLL